MTLLFPLQEVNHYVILQIQVRVSFRKRHHLENDVVSVYYCLLLLYLVRVIRYNGLGTPYTLTLASLYYRQLSSKGGDASHNSNFFSVTHTTFLKKPNSSKTTEAISINLFLIETRFPPLQLFEEFL